MIRKIRMFTELSRLVSVGTYLRHDAVCTYVRHHVELPFLNYRYVFDSAYLHFEVVTGPNADCID